MSLFAGAVGCPTAIAVRDCLEKFAITLDGLGGARSRHWRSGSAALVHRQRLFTPEDKAERQPLSGGRLVVMLDGRLDNRDDLAEALTMRITGVPDSAIVLAALERWGDDAVTRLRGPFALAWWDEDECRLVLARDQLGHRTLYYVDTADGFAFATTPRALLALPDVPRRIDEAALAAFMVDLPLPPGNSFFEKIGLVPAAHLAVWTPGQFRLRQYWQPDSTRTIHYGQDDDYVEAAREHLTRAVRSCLRTDRPIASDLTGGLDSTAVATTAARLLAPARLTTVTAIPDEGVPVPTYRNRFVNEGHHAQATAALYPNMDAHLVVGSAVQRTETNPERLFLSMGRPLRNTMNVGWFTPIYELAKAQGVGVLLQGSGGNLTLSWDGASGLGDAARSGRLMRLWREIPPRARALNLSLGRAVWSMALRPLLPIATPEWFDRLRGRPPQWSIQMSSIHPGFAAAHRVGDLKTRWYNDYYKGSEQRARHQLLTIHQSRTQVMSSLRAIYGFEVREPLCDLRLLEFCFAVPNDQYLRNGVTRWLARRVLAGQAPPEVVNNPRRGAQAPEFLHRLAPRRAEFLATIEELERSPLASRCLDLPRLKTLAHTMPTDPAAEHLIPYVAVLDRGLHVGRFIRWVEGGNG